MSYKMTGILSEVFSEIQVSEKFKKREFVIDVTNGEYVDNIKVQLTQDRCSLIDNYQILDKITVSFNVRGRKWEKDGKVNYFTNIEGWRIEDN